jgi:hypothetical protein
MSIYWEADYKILRLRKRPNLLSLKTKTARLPFSQLGQKEIEVPELYNAYNYNMGIVNVAD